MLALIIIHSEYFDDRVLFFDREQNRESRIQEFKVITEINNLEPAIFIKIDDATDIEFVQ